jgi:hypothetical protein
LVNIFTDPKARKTPCSIALPSEMWAKIDEYIRLKYNGRLSRSGFIEDFVRQTLEQDGKEIIVDSGPALSVNTIRAYIHRLKDFIADNSKGKTIGNLEAVRRDLVEAADFIEQEINRSRTLTKTDKRQKALREALAEHKARIDSGGVVTNAPPPSSAPTEDSNVKETEEKKPESDSDQVDHEYERLYKEAYADFKEEPLPKPDYGIVNEGRTEKNPYDKTGTEEIFK